MKLKTKLYTEQLKEWPKKGHHIMAQYDDEKIIVYQSYRPAIGNFASKNQFFGGKFSLNRMTWIKPNFLWMMYRNGWGQKEGQEVVLAIHLKRQSFEGYLQEAIHSTFQEHIYNSMDDWKSAVKNSSVRLQWDPDHDPYGTKIERRAVQIGVRNQAIKSYSRDDIIEIEDISAFVNQQYQHVLAKDLVNLIIPEEKPFIPQSDAVCDKLGLDCLI